MFIHHRHLLGLAILLLLICSGCQSAIPGEELPSTTKEVSVTATRQASSKMTSQPTTTPTPRPTFSSLPTPVSQGKSNCPPGGWSLFDERDGLLEDRISTLAVDPQGIVWIGYTGVGLSWMIDGSWSSPSNPANFYRNINTIVPLESGQVWLGTQGGSVGYYRHQEWEEVSLGQDYFGPAVYTAGISPQGEVVLGTSDGLYYWDGADPPGFSLFNPGGFSVKSVLWDSTGALWVGGKYNIYLYQDGVWGMFDRGSEPYYDVVDIAQLPNGELWFATMQGIYSYDGSVWTRNFPPPVAGDQDSADVWVNSLAVDQDGRVWAVVDWKEIHVYESGSWELMPQQVNAPVMSFSRVEVDPWGALWFGTNQGVVCFLP